MLPPAQMSSIWGSCKVVYAGAWRVGTPARVGGSRRGEALGGCIGEHIDSVQRLCRQGDKDMGTGDLGRL